jgi:protein-tyrosine phosphatase
MELDYTSGCVNFRDVGEWVNTIASKKIMPEKKIYRGGKIKYIKTLSEIGKPKTIINLTNGPEQSDLISTCDYFNFPISNNFEKYNTRLKEVRKWLNNIAETFEKKIKKFPVFIHCMSGKDRTGIVVASLLSIIGIEKSIIIEEYMLSEGDINKGLITTALDGIEKLNEYFNKIDINTLRKKIIE